MTKRLTARENVLQVVKFVLFSISAGIIQIVSFTLMNEFIRWAEWISYLIALVLSVLWNFTLNRRFTFRSANNVALAMFLVALYYAAFAPLSSWWTDALCAVGWNEYLVLAGTMLVNFLTEFLYSRFIVYRHSIDTNDLARRREAKRSGCGEEERTSDWQTDNPSA